MVGLAWAGRRRVGRCRWHGRRPPCGTARRPPAARPKGLYCLGCLPAAGGGGAPACGRGRPARRISPRTQTQGGQRGLAEEHIDAAVGGQQAREGEPLRAPGPVRAGWWRLPVGAHLRDLVQFPLDQSRRRLRRTPVRGGRAEPAEALQTPKQLLALGVGRPRRAGTLPARPVRAGLPSQAAFPASPNRGAYVLVDLLVSGVLAHVIPLPVWVSQCARFGCFCDGRQPNAQGTSPHPMGRQRVHAGVRRTAVARRGSTRPVRPATDVSHPRHRPVHRFAGRCHGRLLAMSQSGSSSAHRAGRRTAIASPAALALVTTTSRKMRRETRRPLTPGPGILTACPVPLSGATRAAAAVRRPRRVPALRGLGAGGPGASRNGVTLYRGGHVYSPASPRATALLVDGKQVAWVGEEAAANGFPAEVTVDLQGAFVAPAFVDAHVRCWLPGCWPCHSTSA